MSDSGFDTLGGNYYISAASLLLEYRLFIDSHPTLFKVNAANPYWPKLVYFCEELEMFPDVMRAITRIHINSQMDFERALFCSWCALLIAKALKLSEEHQRLVFVAGLLQDIGKHTPDEKVTDMTKKLSGPISALITSERLMDNHPLISARLVERYLPELRGLGELVLHHHARNDGTGYPSHIGENQLALDCQIVITANELSDRLDVLGGHNQIFKTLPNLKLNALLYFPKVHLAWVCLLEPNLSKSIKLNEFGLHDEIKAHVYNLEKMLSCLLVLSAELLPYDHDLTVHGLRSMIHRLACLSTDTGVFDPKLFTLRVNEAINNEPYEHQDLAHQTCEGSINEPSSSEPQDNCQVVRDIALTLKGLPEILNRMISLVDGILRGKKYDINYSLLQSAKEQLYKNSKSLEGPRCSLFR